MRQMMKSKTSGEILVVDQDLKLASDWLYYDELDAPLSEYELDHSIENFSAGAFVVVR